MNKNTSGTGLPSRRPAFLTSGHRGFEPTRANLSPRTTWKPDGSTRKILAVVEAMPKLATSLGLSMATCPDASVEILPGSPTTIAFVAGGKLKGLFVLPVSEEEARRTLGIPTFSVSDLAADRWFEEEREQELMDPYELLSDARHEAWGL